MPEVKYIFLQFLRKLQLYITEGGGPSVKSCENPVFVVQTRGQTGEELLMVLTDLRSGMWPLPASGLRPASHLHLSISLAHSEEKL